MLTPLKHDSGVSLTIQAGKGLRTRRNMVTNSGRSGLLLIHGQRNSARPVTRLFAVESLLTYLP
jgi:hypothetical protein